MEININQLNYLVLILDINGQIIFANDHFLKSTGYNLSEIQSKKIDILDSNYFNNEVANLTSRDSNFSIIDYYTLIKCQSGDILSANVSLSLIEEKKNSKILYQATKTAANSSAHFRKIIDKLLVPTIITNKENKSIIYCNQSASQLYNYRINELIGKPFMELFVVDDNINDNKKTYPEDVKTSINKYTHKTKNGKSIIVNVISYYDDNISKDLIINHIQEVTSENNTVSLYPNLYKDMEIIIDSIGFGVILIDMDLKIRNINEYAIRFLGYDYDNELKGKKCSNVICQLSGDCHKFEFDNNSSLKERIIRNKEGKEIPVLMDSRVIVFQGKKIILESFIDITKMKEAELSLELQRKELKSTVSERTDLLEKQREHLEKSQKALSFLLEDMDEAREELLIANQYMRAANRELESFSYSVSHDLRSPLTRLDGFSKALLDLYGDKLDDKGKHYLNRIRISSQHMADLINDLLKLSRITRSEINKQHISITSISKKIIEEILETDSSRNISFTVDDDLISFGDITLIKSLLENLIGNAVKFSMKNQSPIIKIGKTNIDNNEYFFVKDNGVGFEMKYYDKLFSAFQRLHSNEEFPGTGIGLASVQRIINKHNGHIYAESELGKGTTFFFTLSPLISARK